jgi:hypothetical protein
MTRATPRRVDGWTDEHHRADELGSLHGKLGNDLATHRVRDECGMSKPDSVDPVPKDVGQVSHAGSLTCAAAPALAGQIRYERREAFREHSRKREHVRPGDAVSVHEHDRRAIARDKPVHSHPARDNGPEAAHRRRPS